MAASIPDYKKKIKETMLNVKIWNKRINANEEKACMVDIKKIPEKILKTTIYRLWLL
jgi:hypothetical protein